MGKIQGDCGKQTEQELALFLRGLKYWAYIVPKKVGGQPFDVIACKKTRSGFWTQNILKQQKRLSRWTELSQINGHQWNSHTNLLMSKTWALQYFGKENTIFIFSIITMQFASEKTALNR